MDKAKRRVVCAAIRHAPSGLIVAGARHFDSIMRAQLKACGLIGQNHADLEQGFIDQWGTFMTRRAAFAVARRAGQEINAERNGGFHARKELCSEGLY